MNVVGVNRASRIFVLYKRFSNVVIQLSLPTKIMTTPKYRTLTEADTVQEGDEFELMTTGEWFPVAHSIDQRGSSHYRRLVEAPCICESNDAILRRLSDTATLLMEANAENHALTNRLEALSAAQVSTDYYFTLLTDIGSMFGLRASISEEGSICDHVIVEKIPELVAELIVKNETM